MLYNAFIDLNSTNLKASGHRYGHCSSKVPNEGSKEEENAEY